MKHKDSFRDRDAAVKYLESHGWMMSTILPTGSILLDHNSSNDRRGVQMGADQKWHIIRDQSTLKHW